MVMVDTDRKKRVIVKKNPGKGLPKLPAMPAKPYCIHMVLTAIAAAQTLNHDSFVLDAGTISTLILQGSPTTQVSLCWAFQYVINLMKEQRLTYG